MSRMSRCPTLVSVRYLYHTHMTRIEKVRQVLEKCPENGFFSLNECLICVWYSYNVCRTIQTNVLKRNCFSHCFNTPYTLLG